MDNTIFLSTLAISGRELTAIKEVSDVTYQDVYMAFGKKGVATLADEKFAVCRHRKVIATGITTIEWANGSYSREVAFDAPETLTYLFLK